MVLSRLWKHRHIKTRNNVPSEIVSFRCATHFPSLEFNNLAFWPCFCRHTFENNFSNQNSINIKKTQSLWLLILFTVFVVVSGITYTRLQYIYSLNQMISNIFLWKGIPYIAFPWATKKFPSFILLIILWRR